MPAPTDQPVDRSFDRAAYRERNGVERPIARLTRWRRIAARYW